MIEVVENFFTQDELDLYKSQLHGMKNGPFYWCPIEEFDGADPIFQMLGKAWNRWLDGSGDYVEQVAGAEFWKHHRTPLENNYLDWHIDGDEYAILKLVEQAGYREEDYMDPVKRAEIIQYLRDNTDKWPQPHMGCVIYLDTEGLIGGNLEIDDGEQIHSLSPKANTVVFFKAAIYNHRVTEVEAGVRTIVASNLWAVKPSEENYVKLLS